MDGIGERLVFIGRKNKDPDFYLDLWNFLDEIDIGQFRTDLKERLSCKHLNNQKIET